MLIFDIFFIFNDFEILYVKKKLLLKINKSDCFDIGMLIVGGLLFNILGVKVVGLGIDFKWFVLFR